MPVSLDGASTTNSADDLFAATFDFLLKDFPAVSFAIVSVNCDPL
jgi:hypothetical protein